jgi:parallel beta-helix repeat protein
MYLSGTDHLIENVEVYGSNSYCLIFYYTLTPKPARNVVRNSTFHDCALTMPSSSAILLAGEEGDAAYNNVLYRNRGHGIITKSGTNAKIYNNTVYGGSQTGIYVFPGAMNAEVRNNIAYGNATTQILNEGSGTMISNNMTNDPRFVDAGALNFSLQTSSPAIDAGAALGLVTMDIRRTPRPQGTTHDIGAFEGTGSNAAPAPPRNLSVR